MTGKKQKQSTESDGSPQKEKAGMRGEFILAIIGSLTTIIVAILGAPWITDLLAREEPTPAAEPAAMIAPAAADGLAGENPMEESPLVISDVIVHSNGNGNYELDFRVANIGDSQVLVNRVLFQVVSIRGIFPTTGGGLAYADITDPADLCFYANKEETLDLPLAVKLDPGGVNRFAALLTCGWTAWGRFLVVKTSLETSAGSVAYEEELDLPMSPLSDEQTKMVDAVEAGSAPEVRALLNLYPYLHTIPVLGEPQSPLDILYTAAGDGQAEIVQLLLDAIPRPYAADRLEAAAGISVERGNSRILQLFLDVGVDPNARQKIAVDCWKRHADELIAANGNLETYYIASGHGFCPSVPQAFSDSFGVTLLHKAVYYNYEDVAQLLFSHGADAFVMDENEQTPIDYALEKGHLELAQFLGNKK